MPHLTLGAPPAFNGARYGTPIKAQIADKAVHGHRSVLADRSEECAWPLAGLATTVAAAGVPSESYSSHKSMVILRGYVREGRCSRDAAALVGSEPTQSQARPLRNTRGKPRVAICMARSGCFLVSHNRYDPAQ